MTFSLWLVLCYKIYESRESNNLLATSHRVGSTVKTICSRLNWGLFVFYDCLWIVIADCCSVVTSVLKAKIVDSNYKNEVL